MTYDEANNAAVNAFTARIKARIAIERAAAKGGDLCRLWCEYDLATAEEAALRARATLLFNTREA